MVNMSPSARLSNLMPDPGRQISEGIPPRNWRRPVMVVNGVDFQAADGVGHSWDVQKSAHSFQA